MCRWICMVSQYLALAVCLPLVYTKRYDGYKVVHVLPQTADDVDALARWHVHGGDEMEVWNEADLLQGYKNPDAYSPLKLHIAPHALPRLRELLDSRALTSQVVSDNLQDDLDDYLQTLKNRPTTDYFQTYHTFEEILNYVSSLAETCGSRCSVFDIGDSYEGRPLRVLKVTNGSGVAKRAVWIDAGIHAREWISHATNQYLMTQMVRGYDTDDMVRRMTDTYDWYFLPCVNPDGYHHSWTADRLWRKTRSPHPGPYSQCYGVDANRNFDFHWGTVGVSFDPCSNTYPGEHPFSEPESSAVARHILQNNGSWELFITLHSKGQFVLVPWGYTDNKPWDYGELTNVGVAMQKAIFSTHGKFYTYGTSADVLYKSSGTSRDWAKGVAGVPFVFTLELRDRGQYGWLLPADQIIPTGEEIWEGLKAAFDAIQDS